MDKDVRCGRHDGPNHDSKCAACSAPPVSSSANTGYNSLATAEDIHADSSVESWRPIDNENENEGAGPPAKESVDHAQQSAWRWLLNGAQGWTRTDGESQQPPMK